MPIVVLIGSLLGVISCTQPTESDGCSIDEFRVSARSRSENCPRVWLGIPPHVHSCNVL